MIILRNLVLAGVLAWLGGFAADTYGQTVPCETSTIVTSDGKTTGKIIACSRHSRDVPALTAMVERLNAAVAKNTEGQRDLERFVRSLSATSKELSPKYITQLAQSLADRISKSNAGNDERLVREIDRMRVELDEVRDKLTDARSKGDSAKTQAALDGQAGAAIAALNFVEAKRMLDDLAKIVIQTTGPFTASPQLLARTRDEVARTWDRLTAARAPERCPQLWKELVDDRKSAFEAQARGLAEAAGNMLVGLNERGGSLLAELQLSEEMANMPRKAYEQLYPVIRDMKDTSISNFSKPPVRHVPAPTPQQRDFLQEGIQLFEQSEVLAKRGNFAEAYARLQDAHQAFVASKIGRKITVGTRMTVPSFPNAQCR